MTLHTRMIRYDVDLAGYLRRTRFQLVQASAYFSMIMKTICSMASQG